METTLLYLALGGLVVYLLFKWTEEGVLSIMGIDHPSPLPIVGNLLPVLQQKLSIVDLLEKIYQDFSHKKIFGFYNFFGSANIVIADLELLKQVAVKDFDHFAQRVPKSLGDVDQITGKSILFTTDQKWKDMRNVLNPIYTSAKIKLIFHVLSDCVLDFVSFYEDKAAENRGSTKFDASEAFARITADGIASTAFGFKGDSTRNKNSEIYEIAYAIDDDFSNPLKGFFIRIFPKLFKFFGIQVFSTKVKNFFEANVLGEIRRRKDLKIHKPDVIHQLMLAQDEKLDNGTLKWTDDDLVAQGLTIFLGGFSTTTNLMEACCFELSSNPKIQQTLIDEVDEALVALNGEKMSYEQLNQMKFLEMVINETLRKWPPVRFAQRICGKDSVVKTKDGRSFNVKKDTSIFLPYGAILKDPIYFTDPDKFDPYRFSDENKEKIPSGTFIPFGLGPRICLGSRYALLEAKLLLFMMMTKFSIEKCEGSPDKLTFKLTSVGFQEKIKLEFKLRKK